jgi:glucokinase
MADVMISVDLGGTRVRSARLDHQLNILERHETLTLADEGLEATLDRVKDLIQNVWPQNEDCVVVIGVSAPGPLNPTTGVVVAPPNLPGWHNVPLKDQIEDAFGVPVYVGNDANVAALAETARGAARGYRHVIYITVSTGIGSGMIIDGRLLLGKEGLAGEAGHIVIVTASDRVTDLEEEAAGPALADQARAQINAGVSSTILDLVAGDLDRITGKHVGQAAAQGDSLALGIVQRAGRLLGLGVVSLLHLFNPEILVIGGGVSKTGELLFAPMRAAIQEHALDTAYWQNLSIEQAALDEDVSIIGAAVLVITQGGQTSLAEVLEKLGD